MKIDYLATLEQLTNKAEEYGLFDNALFVSTFQSYVNNVKYLKTLAKEEEFEKYLSCSVKNAKIAFVLFKMIGDEENAEKFDSVSKKKTMPNFSKLTPAKISFWCKHFDIDPSDYSKEYLYKALEKRWKFENE